MGWWDDLGLFIIGVVALAIIVSRFSRSHQRSFEITFVIKRRTRDSTETDKDHDHSDHVTDPEPPEA